MWEGKKREACPLAIPSLQTHLQTVSSSPANLGSVHGYEMNIKCFTLLGASAGAVLELVEKYQKLEKQLSNKLSGAFLVLPKVNEHKGFLMGGFMECQSNVQQMYWCFVYTPLQALRPHAQPLQLAQTSYPAKAMLYYFISFFLIKKSFILILKLLMIIFLP